MFHYYTSIFSFHVNYFVGPSVLPTDRDGNNSNIDEILDAISSDNRIDGNDKILVDALLNALDESNKNITNETKEAISSSLSKELKNSLELGYTVSDEASYDTYVRIMAFMHPDISIPQYGTIKSTAANSGFFEAQYSFVYNPSNKNISVHYVELPHGVAGTLLGTIQNGEYTQDHDVSTMDLYRNNNQFNLSGDSIDQTLEIAEKERLIKVQERREKMAKEEAILEEIDRQRLETKKKRLTKIQEDAERAMQESPIPAPEIKAKPKKELKPLPDMEIKIPQLVKKPDLKKVVPPEILADEEKLSDLAAAPVIKVEEKPLADIENERLEKARLAKIQEDAERAMQESPIPAPEIKAKPKKALKPLPDMEIKIPQLVKKPDVEEVVKTKVPNLVAVPVGEVEVNPLPKVVIKPKKVVVQPKVEIAPTPDRYIVKRGDVLWRIVKDHYGLTDNKEIADRVNAVVEAQTDAKLGKRLRRDTYGGGKPNVKDGIMGDVLYPGDDILLPVYP